MANGAYGENDTPLGGAYGANDTPSGKPGALGDLVQSLKSGVQQIPGTVTALADLPFALTAGARPFTRAADALGEATGFQPGKWAKESKHSDQYAASQRDVGQAWAASDAVQKDPNASALDYAGKLLSDAPEIASAYLRNPMYTANQATESLPGMFVGGALSKGVKAVGAMAGRGLSAEAVAAGAMGPVRQAVPGHLERAVGANWVNPVAAGVGEGAITAGQALDQSKGADQQRNALAALGAGVGTGLIGIGAGRAANAMGLETAGTAMAKAGGGTLGGGLSAARRIGAGAITEGLLEELPQSTQEAMWQNYAEGKPLMEGVVRQGVEGTLAGGLMGAGANVIHSKQQQPPAAPPPPTTPEVNAALAETDAALADYEGLLPDQRQLGYTPGSSTTAAGMAPSPDTPLTNMATPRAPNTPLTNMALDAEESGLTASMANQVGPLIRSYSTPQEAEAAMVGREDADRVQVGRHPRDKTRFSVLPKSAQALAAQDAKAAMDAQALASNQARTQQIEDEDGNAPPSTAPGVETVDMAAHAAASSPLNDRTEPTERQIKAGNYAKGHITLGGLKLAIENPVGSVRRGVDTSGAPWQTEMNHHYGYVKASTGADGSGVDAFVKGQTPVNYAGPVFVIDQVDPRTGNFDEHKTVIGASTAEEAKAIYLSNYAPGWQGMGAVTEMPFAAFKTWVRDGVKDAPLAQTESTAQDELQAPVAQPLAEMPAPARMGARMREAARLAAQQRTAQLATEEAGTPPLPEQPKARNATQATQAQQAKPQAQTTEADDAQSEIAQSTGKMSLPRVERIAGESDTDYQYRVAAAAQARKTAAVKQQSEPKVPPTKDRDLQAAVKALGDRATGNEAIVSVDEMPDIKTAGENGISRQMAKYITQVARVFGKRVVFVKGMAADGMRTAGNTIYLATDSSVAHLRVLGHELLHALKAQKGDAYAKMLEAVKGLLTDEVYAAEYKNYHGKLLAEGTVLSESEKSFLAEEWLADLSGNRFAEADFWHDVFAQIEDKYGAPAAKGIIARLRLALVSALNQLMKLVSGPAFAADSTVQGHLAEVRKAITDGFAAYAQAVKTGDLDSEAGVSGESKFAPRKPESGIGHKRMGAIGRYVGAPDWVGGSPQQLTVLRKKLRQLAGEGESGRFWYEKSSKAVMDLVGGDKADAEKFVGLLAIYSQGTEVNVNLGFALEAYYQWRAGLLVSTGRFPTAQGKKAKAWLKDGTDWGGIKTNNFYMDLMEEIDPSKFEEGHATMDMWMALAFDYGAKVLDQGPKYNFAKRETVRLADELGWKPHQVQAAIWTAIKSRVEGSEKTRNAKELAAGIAVKNGGAHAIVKGREYDHFRMAHKVGMEHSITKEQIAENGVDFADALTQRAVQMSWEATPSVTGGDLPGIHKAPTAQKMEYLEAISKVLTPDGKDLIAEMINLHTPPTVFGFSAWEGAVGAGAQSFFPTPIIGQGKDRAVLKVARDMLGLYSAIKGLVLKQDAVVWHTPVWDDAKARQNGVHIGTARGLTEAEMRQLYSALHDRFDTWELAPGWRPDGVRVLNFVERASGEGSDSVPGIPTKWGKPTVVLRDGDWNETDVKDFSLKDGTVTVAQKPPQGSVVVVKLNNGVFQKGMDAVIASLPSDFADGGVAHAGFRSDGDYIGNDWTENENGSQYKVRIQEGRPDILGRVADLRARVEAVNSEFSEKYDWGNPGTIKFSTRRDGYDQRGVYGENGPGADPFSVSVTGTHFSQQARANLVGAYNGTGLKGAEAKRLAESTDSRIKSRVYFYVDEGNGLVPESGVGGVAHSADLKNLYNTKGDPLKLFKSSDLNGSESRVLDAGYNGYYFPSHSNNQGIAVVLGKAADSIPVTVAGYDKGKAPVAAPEPYKRGLTSKELNAIDVEALQAAAPSAKLRSGTLSLDASELPAARTALAKQGIDLPEAAPRFSNKRFADTPEFKKWFGDSKVVNADGKPLVVYHGTKSDFVKFDTVRMGTGSTMFGAYKVERHGIFITPHAELANDFALQGDRHERTGANVMPLYARIENPLDMTLGYTDAIFNAVEKWGDGKDLNGYRVARNLGDNWGDWVLFDADGGQDPALLIEMLRDLGYDGVKYHEPQVAGEGASGDSYVAFDPEQIKSAIGNNGDFDGANPDIRFSEKRFAEVEREAYAMVEADPEGMISAYLAKHRNVIDPDLVKGMFPAFKADPSLAAAVHEPSSKLAKMIYTEALKRNKGKEVVFTAGGGGSGKSEAMPVARAVAGIVGGPLTYDSTLSSYASAIQRIDQALGSGAPVTIVYTNAPVGKAFGFAMGRERVVPVQAIVAAHVGASNTIRRLAEHYRDSPNVRIVVINNDAAKADIRTGDVDDVPKYEQNDVERSLYELASQARDSGQITNERYAALLEGRGEGSPGKGDSPIQEGHGGQELGRPGGRAGSGGSKLSRWFGEDSTLVNADGSPMVLYHGTTAKNERALGVFRRSKIGAMGPAIYLGDSKEASAGYDDGALMQVYARGKYLTNMQWTDYISKHGWTGAEKAARADGFSGVYDSMFENAIAVWDPQDIKSATKNNGDFDPQNPDIRYSPKRTEPFYSALSQEVGKLKLNAAPAFGWRDAIKGLINKGQVKQDEVEWTGLGDWLELQQGKVTRDQVQQYLDQNGVRVEETTLGAKADLEKLNAKIEPEGYTAYEDRIEHTTYFVDEDGDHLDYSDLPEYIQKMVDKADGSAKTGPAKFAQYVVPGGENYRGVLLTLPENTLKPKQTYQDWVKNGAPGSQWSTEDGKSPVYTSGHWDQRNVLAHLRLDDHTDADGNKTLFVQEIQSDWGQTGKKIGFAEKEWWVQLSNGDKEYYKNEQEANRIARENNTEAHPVTYAAGKVPTAPFVKTTEGWLNLALKRVIKMAVDGGYDKVAFANGEQNAAHYDLSKEMDTLLYDSGDGSVIGRKDGSNVITKTVNHSSEIADLVGKDIAERLLKSPKNGHGMHELKGLELKMGGEGMRTFYDKMVPIAAGKLAAKLGGGKVETAILVAPDTGVRRKYMAGFEISTEKWGVKDTTSGEFVKMAENSEAAQSLAAEMSSTQGRLEQPSITITDKMRESAAGGLPLFSNRRAFEAPLASSFDDVVYKMQDKMVDVKRVVEAITKSVGKIADNINVYLQEELFHGRAAKRVADFGAQELKPLMTLMRMNGLDLEAVEEYLHARHAKEANALIAQREPSMPDGGSGMTNAAAAAYMAKLDPGQRAKLETVAKKVDAIIGKTRQTYADYGLESQATVDAWGSMFKSYVPLMREDKDGGMGIGQGFSVKGRETKGRTGSTRKVVDILANIAMQRERAIVRGEKNRVGQALLGLAQANPNDEFWTVRSQAPTERVYDPKTNAVVDRPDMMFKQRDSVLGAKVKDSKGNVVEQYVEFNEGNDRAKRMAVALKNLDAGNLEGLLGASAKITRYFSSVNTQYNPVFGVVNLIRDVQGAMINLGATPLAGKQAGIAKDTLAALAGIYGDIRQVRKGGVATSKWATLWEQMQADGGTTGYRDLFKTSQDRADALKDELNPDAWMDSKLGKMFTANGALKAPMGAAKGGADALFGWLSDYNEAMENGVRLAAYKAALDAGMSRQQAASLSKNLTVNFNRKGQIGQQAGALYAFFNAAMQGTAKIGQTLFDMDGGDLKTLRLSPLGKKVVYGGMLLGSMQALALAAAGFSDEDPPEFLRERSLIIPTGGKSYVSIPMPQGLHVIPGLGRHATEFALSGGKKPAKRAVSVFGMFADAFNPIGNSGMSIQTIAPTAIDPLVALTENRDWTGRPIARTSSNKALPGHDQWKDTATGWSKVLAEGINLMSGGNKYVAGAISPTPDQIDYLIAQATGGVGREASKVEQTIKSLVRGEDLPTYKVPLVGRFYGNTASQSGEGTKFYANSEKLNELETELKGLRKDGKHAEATALLASRPEAQLIMQVNHAEQQIQKLKREKRKLVAQSADRDMVRAKEAQITEVMSRTNRATERLMSH